MSARHLRNAPRRLWYSAALSFALTLASACSDSSTAPHPPVLRIGSVVSGQLAAVNDTARYELDLSDGRDASIFLTVHGSPVMLEVLDDTGRVVANTNGVEPLGADPLNPSSNVRSAPHRYRVRVRLDTRDQPPGGPGDYEIRIVAQSRLPEHVPTLLPFDTPVSGEDIHHAMDVDSFTVTSPQQRDVEVYARQTAHSGELLGVSVVQDQYITRKNFFVSASDSVFGAQVSGRVTLAAGVKYAVFVYTWGFDTTATPYEIELRTVDHRPEGGTADLVPGDTVRGMIDYVGDVDDYTLSAPVGALFNLFATAGGAWPHGVHVAVGAEYGGENIFADANGSPMAESATGNFEIPAGGKTSVSVSDLYDRGGDFVGPYSFVVVPIDLAPEGTSPDLTLDSPVSSALEMLGDIDEFSLTLAQDTNVTVELRRASSTPLGAIMLTLLESPGHFVARTTLGGGDPADPLPPATLGTLRLHAGRYILRVEGFVSGWTGFTGGYELVARTSSAPVTP